jgi:hypothetical protein
VIVTSRLLPRPGNLYFEAQSASGKTYTIESGLELHPDEAYYKLSASSERALIYTPTTFQGGPSRILADTDFRSRRGDHLHGCSHIYSRCRAEVTGWGGWFVGT